MMSRLPSIATTRNLRSRLPIVALKSASRSMEYATQTTPNRNGTMYQTRPRNASGSAKSR